MAEKNVVPDPKSGRVVNPQKPNVEKPYIDQVDFDRRTNELTELQARLSKTRLAMGQLQSVASRSKRKYGFVPEDVRVALKASRDSHRDLVTLISVIRRSLRISGGDAQ